MARTDFNYFNETVNYETTRFCSPPLTNQRVSFLWVHNYPPSFVFPVAGSCMQEEVTFGIEFKDVFKNTFTAAFKQEGVNSETDITSYKSSQTTTQNFGTNCFCPVGIPDNSLV